MSDQKNIPLGAPGLPLVWALRDLPDTRLLAGLRYCEQLGESCRGEGPERRKR